MTISQRLTDLMAQSTISGIKITTTYEAGSATISPPAGHLPSLTETPGLFTLPDGRKAVSLDTQGSQANRFEQALKSVAEQINYPLITVVDPTKGAEGQVISTSLDWPHRHADAHSRMLREPIAAAGIDYDAVMHATIADPAALLRHFPASLAYGWWHSQTSGRYETKAARDAHIKSLGGDKDVFEAALGYHVAAAPDLRSARVITSEIIAQGISLKPRLAAKSDPFGSLPGKSTDSKGFPGLGLGTLAPMDGPCDVIAEEVIGTAFVSLSYLRRFALSAQDQAVVLALILLAVQVSDDDLHLRSGADLARTGRTVQLATGTELADFEMPSRKDLITFLSKEGKRLGWAPVQIEATEAYLKVRDVARTHAKAAE